jgi:hypothetical protein
MRQVNEEMKERYDKLHGSGMFWEFYPDLTGDWEKDEESFTSAELELDKIRVQNEPTLTLETPVYPILALYTPEKEEILRFEQDGNIYIHGRLVTEDMEVVNGFREFLVAQGIIK